MITFGAKFVSIPLDEHGMRVDAAEEALRRLRDEGKRAKLIYSIPNFQNPAGVTMRQDRREKLVELAREYQTLIMEDDAYGELWFDSAPPPSFFALSRGEDAIKVSTFSKIIATGLRMGWTMAPPALISRMAAVRYDMGSSPYQGHIIADLISSGDLDRHVVRLREVYRKKLARTEDAIGRYCGAHTSYQVPQGGFFLWLKLRDDIPSREVQQAAMERGVVVGQGPQFFVDGNATNHLRLAFSYVPIEDIEEGIHRLGDAIAEVAGRATPK
jgi:2-aminoadipate transaminase